MPSGMVLKARRLSGWHRRLRYGEKKSVGVGEDLLGGSHLQSLKADVALLTNGCCGTKFCGLKAHGSGSVS
jgi:hypothetical protein